MQFLSDVYVPCAECGGARFTAEVLEVRYRGGTSRDVLDAHRRRGRRVLRRRPRRRATSCGRSPTSASTTSASGSRSRRSRAARRSAIKLAAHLGREGKAHTLFIFDEPTTGLHLADVEKLLAVLHAARRPRALAASSSSTTSRS